MATLVEPGPDIDLSNSVQNPPSSSPSLSHRFLDNKFYLLVVIGEVVTEEHLRCAIANIERVSRAVMLNPGTTTHHSLVAFCNQGFLHHCFRVATLV
ncbi:hypothetical protein GDO86_019690 [Hymenochirus boettgeri]|uniref:Uncharacterized protein n=1 Tax=Hymenochirus boettgeri TaxID=247094 RepID=A0A8T2IEM6_9PIPI|nr:hypothetical protein GDO86_019690 [Hymenochirus boettgeri]